MPLHFSAFHPDYKLSDIPQTPTETVIRARNIALNAGLNYVYTGNVHYTEGDTTFCPSCDNELIVRDWYEIKQYHLTADGRCTSCNAAIAGCAISKRTTICHDVMLQCVRFTCVRFTCVRYSL